MDRPKANWATVVHSNKIWAGLRVRPRGTHPRDTNKVHHRDTKGLLLAIEATRGLFCVSRSPEIRRYVGQSCEWATPNGGCCNQVDSHCASVHKRCHSNGYILHGLILSKKC
jgi:hypothetical protein